MKQSEYKKTPLYLYRNAKKSTPDWTSYDLTVDNPDDEHDRSIHCPIDDGFAGRNPRYARSDVPNRRISLPKAVSQSLRQVLDTVYRRLSSEITGIGLG